MNEQQATQNIQLYQKQRTDQQQKNTNIQRPAPNSNIIRRSNGYFMR